MKKNTHSTPLVPEDGLIINANGLGSMKEEGKMIHLKRAKFCVQCEMIFNGRAEVCPVCLSPSWMPLEKWLNQPELEIDHMAGAA